MPSCCSPPCYYSLRLLGVWQPRDALKILKFYNTVSWLFFFGYSGSIFALSYIHKASFGIYEVLNSIGTIVDFCFPFLFLKYYFHFGNFEQLMNHIIEQNGTEGAKKIKKYRWIYTILSSFIWLLMVVFFTFHWIPFFKELWHYILYSAVLIYTLGWWGTWLCVYGFVCHVHKYQIKTFVVSMEARQSQIAIESSDDEKFTCQLLSEFNHIQLWLNQTQKHFSKIISLAVIYHIADMIVFTMAYWNGSFGDHYKLWQFFGTIIFDTLSILIKLYPAAVVDQALNDLVQTSGDQCLVDRSCSIIPYARINLYQHFSSRRQDMGFYILGIKITIRKAIAVFVFCGTVTVAFFRLFITSGNTFM